MEVIGTQAEKKLIERKRRDTYQNSLEHYLAIIPKGFAYEFLESDYKRLQELLNDLRTLTTESEQIEENHKRRLLRKIEKLQQELNKRMSNLDVLWGLVGEAGIAIGKFGEDVKPFCDRLREIFIIVVSTQARAHGLPESVIPLLGVLTEEPEQMGSGEKNR